MNWKLKASDFSKPMMAFIAVAVGISMIASAALISNEVRVTNTVVSNAGTVSIGIADTTGIGGDYINLPDSAVDILKGQTYDLNLTVDVLVTANAVLKYKVLNGSANALPSDFVLKYYDGSTWNVLAAQAGSIGATRALVEGTDLSIPMTVNYAAIGTFSIVFWLENA